MLVKHFQGVSYIHQHGTYHTYMYTSTHGIYTYINTVLSINETV